MNTVSAGPMKTMAGKGIPGFDTIAGSWAERAARLGHDRRAAGGRRDRVPALGFVRGHHRELVHVDGGFHAMGTEPGGSPDEDPDDG